MEQNDSIILMSEDRVRRTVHRMAHEINEMNKADKKIALLGINQRGFALAAVLGETLSGITGSSVVTDQLMVDAKEQKRGAPAGDTYDGSWFIVIVDDVIFSGRTMFRALSATVAELGPSEIHTAVLIDRGHRKIPVQADFYGMELPTKLDEHVSVRVDKERVKKVVLSRK